MLYLADYILHELTWTWGHFDTDKRFTGQRLDDTGLYFYNARYYDSTIGRFISADTIVPDSADPQNLNRYTYCLNNPLKYTDPSGHFWDWVVDAVSIVWSTVELVRDPSWANAGMLAADVVLGIVPFVPSVVGPGARAAKAVDKAADATRALDTGTGALKGISRLDDAARVGEVGTAAIRGGRAIVIGENMDSVRSAARVRRTRGVEARWYQFWGKNIPKGRWMTRTELDAAMARNARWIRAKIRAGYDVYDIGLDVNRATRSPFYALERSILEEAGYPVGRLLR